MNKTQIERLRERVSALCGPTLRVTLTNGDTKIVNSASAVDLFKDGRAIHAETHTGGNGLLPDLLNELAETE